jgi:hypothetical protein
MTAARLIAPTARGPQGLGRGGCFFKDPPPSNLLDGNLRLGTMEGALSSFWQDLTAVFGKLSFTWTVLFVVCFACVLALVFDVSIEITFPIVALGCLTAVAEHVMRDRNAHN